MKFGSALATLALLTLIPSVPATAAKDDKLPRCNGRQKRPANPYGTVLPTVPPRNMTSAEGPANAPGVPRGTPALEAAPAPTTNLFPAESAVPPSQGPNATQAGKVPAIGAIEPSAGPTAALPTTHASC
jgi:hypothetical protein